MAFLNGISLLPEKKGAFLFYPAEAVVHRCSVACNFFKKETQVLTLRHWRRCFPLNFVKFLRTPFLTEHLRWLLLILTSSYLNRGGFRLHILNFEFYETKLNVMKYTLNCEIVLKKYFTVYPRL